MALVKVTPFIGTDECGKAYDRAMRENKHSNKRFNCPRCGVDAAVDADFTPVHFTGRLAQLSEGYCTINCARSALDGLRALNAMSGGKLFASIGA
jgi:transcription elongation factor Elf1